MTDQDLRPLPLGQSSFSTLIDNNAIYVDKTDLIYQLVKDDAKIFLARPRRFGKSLLVSTFESLFKYGLRDFGGLSIEKFWSDKTYPVVRLDFSECREFKSLEEFEQKFSRRIEAKFKLAGISLAQTDDDLITRLSDALQTLEVRSVVLLIDEYDAPLTSCLNKKELFDGVRSILSEFFLTIKSQSACLRFFFMTGITKFSNTSIFSAFNNLTDISLVPEYGTLLGITEGELNHYFNGYIQKAATALKMTEVEVLDRLRENYNGFSFDEKANTHVYCPWSVLQFFKLPSYGFQNYWFDSGAQPSVLMNYLTHHELPNPISYCELKEIEINTLKNSSQYEELPLDSLLTQAGYLTIKSNTGDGYLVVGYPNKEVEMSMAQLYAKVLLNGKRIRKPGAPVIADIMATETVDTVIEQFNFAFNAIDHIRYPVNDESICRGYLQMLLRGTAMMPRVENHTSLGRSDLEVDAGNRHWVFEIKFAKTDDDVEELLTEAADQVRDRRYGEVPSTKELIRVAMVFSHTERQFVAWQEI